MLCLLDTNALVWLASGNAEFGKTSRRLVEREPQLFYSAISVVELVMKAMIGKAIFQEDGLQFGQAEGLTELAYTGKHAREIARFGSLVNHDPFDRMILAQASAERMTLITADKRLVALGLSFVLDARL